MVPAIRESETIKWKGVLLPSGIHLPNDSMHTSAFEVGDYNAWRKPQQRGNDRHEG